MSVTLDENTQIEKWKNKYYDNLDKLEEKEVEYQQAEEVLRSALSHLSIAALGTTPAIDQQLEALRSDIRNGDDGDKLKSSIKKIIDNIDRIENKSHEESEPVSKNSNALNTNEILLQLLERLDVQAELTQTVDQLKARLAQDVDDGEWASLIEDIATVIANSRKKYQEEIKGMGQFLSQLTVRLQELYESFQIEKIEHESSYEDRKTLTESVQSHVQNIESSVQQATDLDQIKLTIHERMEAISSNFQRFIVHEEKRIHDAQERTEQLSDRLQLLEKESNELRSRVQQERHAALTDTLTGLSNRMAYDERMAQASAHWKRYKTPLSILVADVDFFKKINDTFGHKAGDKVLQAIADTIRKSVRETDMAARYGGEEFVVIMPDTSINNAEAVANKLRTEIEKLQFHYKSKHVNITISCGVSAFSNNDQSDDVFERADQALYEAKNSGRNCCVAK